MALLRSYMWNFLPVIFIALLLTPLLSSAAGDEGVSRVAGMRLKELVDVQGVRSNYLVGYGLVVGLNKTGDSAKSSPFTTNAMAAMLERFGQSTRDQLASLKMQNVAAVMVTAELPAFARPGQTIDVTVSSIGDAKSLRGGQLLATPLLGGDGQVYSVAQGGVVIGGYSFGDDKGSQSKGHPTSGRIPEGARVERAAPGGLTPSQPMIVLTLRNPDFTTAKNIEAAINDYYNEPVAYAENSSVVKVQNRIGDAIALIAQIEHVKVASDHKATVVIDERTGTIIIGQDVRIDTIAVAHGNISVSITKSEDVSQPGAFSQGGTTATTSNTNVSVAEDRAQLVVVDAKPTLSDLVDALNAVGATPSDLIAVLEAIRVAGALHAELKVM
ncbi:MAG: flagellar basal body P-ring protein FlgI [Zetaproteobacteria bacterium]|nr:flagellar basal body P-ring protein FlgI [Zetaproteobacteria bacterium]